MLSGTFNNFLSSESDFFDTFSDAEMRAHQLILLTFRFRDLSDGKTDKADTELL